MVLGPFSSRALSTCRLSQPAFPFPPSWALECNSMGRHCGRGRNQDARCLAMPEAFLLGVSSQAKVQRIQCAQPRRPAAAVAADNPKPPGLPCTCLGFWGALHLNALKPVLRAREFLGWCPTVPWLVTEPEGVPARESCFMSVSAPDTGWHRPTVYLSSYLAGML